MEPQRVASQGKRNSASNNSLHASGTNGHPTNVRKGSVKINAPKNNTSPPPQKEEVISQEFQKNTVSTKVQVTKKNETIQKETWAELEDSEEHEKQESQENDQFEHQDSEQSE